MIEPIHKVDILECGVEVLFLLWEPKMCRLTLQLLSMLGNVLERPRHALQRPRHALQRPRHACNVLGRPQHAFARS